MAKVSSSITDILTKHNQNPQVKIEIYDSDDVLIQELSDIENFAVSMSEDAFVRRTFFMSINNKDQEYTFLPESKSNNLFWYDKTIKIYAKYDGITSYYDLGSFRIDELPNSISKSLDTIMVRGRDLSKDILTSKFTDIKDYSAGSSDTAITITSATSNDHIAIGDDLVDYDESISYYATINGVKTKVVGTTYTGSDANKFEAEVLIDLKATFNISAISYTSTDTKGDVETSLDNVTWSAFVAGNVRYIRFTITDYREVKNTWADVLTVTWATILENTWNQVLLGNWRDLTVSYSAIGITSATAYPITNAYDSDLDTFYLPDTTKPILTFAFSSATINTILLDWNLADYKQDAVTYEIGYIASGTYTAIETATNVAGRVEHAFTGVTADKIRIEVLAGYGALRETTISNVTATYFLSDVIEDILTDLDFATFTKIQDTHFYNDNLVFHSGDEKYKAISDIANSIGWEFYFDKDGLPVFKPIYYVDSVYDFVIGDDNIFGYDIEISDTIYNQILVINNNGIAGLEYAATDDSLLNATSTVYIGIRTKVFRTDKMDTEAKAKAFAQKELIKGRAEGRVFNIRCFAMPQLEMYDTIRFTDATRGIDSLCRIGSLAWTLEKSRFTMNLKAVEL